MTRFSDRDCHICEHMCIHYAHMEIHNKLCIQVYILPYFLLTCVSICTPTKVTLMLSGSCAAWDPLLDDENRAEHSLSISLNKAKHSSAVWVTPTIKLFISTSINRNIFTWSLWGQWRDLIHGIYLRPSNFLHFHSFMFGFATLPVVVSVWALKV